MSENKKPSKYMIHVLGSVIRDNRNYGGHEPAVVIRQSDWSTRVIICDDVIIQGSSRVIHNAENPARSLDDRTNISVWIETDSPVMFKRDGEMISVNDETFRRFSTEARAGC